MYNKGRANPPRGEKHWKARLDKNKVLKIRKDSRMYKEIARDYKITIECVYNVKKKRTWKHVK